MRRLSRTIRGVLLLGILCAMGGAATLPASSSAPLYTRAQRFGIAFVHSVRVGSTSVPQSFADYYVAPLRVGWYSDWQFHAVPSQPADATLEYVQLVNVRTEDWPPDWSAVQQAVEFNPRATWIIGNEPEGPYNQGKRTPRQYAGIYREAYMRIKGYDPLAKIAIGGVIQPTPLRLRWLEECIAAYQADYGEPMDVDVWNIHVQILPEPGTWGAGIPAGLTPQPGEAREYTMQDCARPANFTALVTDFRTWMKNHGQQNKPLIISEMGVLLPSDYIAPDGQKETGDRLIEQFMVATFDWLLQARSAEIGYALDENRLVQRWLWFSLNDSFYDEAQTGFNGSLYDYHTKTMTRFGLRFAAYQSQTHRLWLPRMSRP